MAQEKTSEQTKKKYTTVGDREEREWGWFEVLDVGPLTCVRKIVIKPRHARSLQMHAERSEQWTVEDGVLTALIGEDLMFGRAADLKAMEVPVGVLHAMINCSDDKSLVVREVQSGRCREDDIVRYRDPYGRACVLSPADHLPTLKSLCLYDAILVCLKND
jgi:mannose-6-phosphate isomerase-like protein (cupin superfamily)